MNILGISGYCKMLLELHLLSSTCHWQTWSSLNNGKKKADIFFVHKATTILCNKFSSCALVNALFGSGCARTTLFLEWSSFSCYPWGAVLVDFLYDSLMYMAHCLANLFFSSRMLNALHPLELNSYWLVSSHHFTWVILYLEKWHELFFLPVILIHCSLYIVCCSVILLVFFTVFFTFWCLLLSASVLSWRQQLVSFIVHIFLPHQAEYFISSSADVSSSWLQSCGIVGFMRLQWLVTATCSVWLHVAGWAVGNVCSFLIICCEGPACFWPTMGRRGFFSVYVSSSCR